MGLMVTILRPADGSDCTNGGVTGRHIHAVLVDAEGPFEPTPDMPGLRLVRRTICGEPYLHAVPVDGPEGDDGLGPRNVGPMFGGSFITSSDSRFRAVNAYPIPVHDRWESARTNDMLSR